jgi:hypothetical protein
LIFNDEKDIFNLDSELMQKEVLLKGKKINNAKEKNTYKQKMSKGKSLIDNKERNLNNLRDKYNSLLSSLFTYVLLQKDSSGKIGCSSHRWFSDAADETYWNNPYSIIRELDVDKYWDSFFNNQL